MIREENPYEEIFKESFMCSKAGKHRRNTMSSMDRRVSFGVVNIRTFQKESAESPAPIAKKKKVVVIPFQVFFFFNVIIKIIYRKLLKIQILTISQCMQTLR